MGKPVYSITPFTLLDYPDKTACILWFAGCNMRCTYCYNPDIVLGKGKLQTADILSFIKSRIHLLDGVVFSGGECTLHPEIFTLAEMVKENGMLIKIDTNGSRPDVLKKLLDKKLADYVAIDYKAPAHSFHKITGSDFHTSFFASLQVLIESGVSYEVRTTVHSSILDKDDLRQMAQNLLDAGYRGEYHIQHFKGDVMTLTPMKSSDQKHYSAISIPNGLKISYRNFLHL